MSDAASMSDFLPGVWQHAVPTQPGAFWYKPSAHHFSRLVTMYFVDGWRVAQFGISDLAPLSEFLWDKTDPVGWWARAEPPEFLAPAAGE